MSLILEVKTVSYILLNHVVDGSWLIILEHERRYPRYLGSVIEGSNRGSLNIIHSFDCNHTNPTLHEVRFH